MATKTDLQQLHSSIMTETRTAIATSVDPLKDEMHDLRERVARLETGHTTSEKKRQMAIMNSLDMAHRRVSFIFENDVNAVDRVAALEEVCLLYTSPSPRD
eukprot:9520046-Alexandrium_andersonii.AAC.1